MKPIHFNTEMVKAILDGRKTQTRRVIKIDQDDYRFDRISENPSIENYCPKTGVSIPKNIKGNYAIFIYCSYRDKYGDDDDYPVVRLPYQTGDILYVKEAYCHFYPASRDIEYGYKADYPEDIKKFRWHSSRYMPKEAARIFLKVTDVRVEKLHEISTSDIRKEGYHNDECSEVICDICIACDLCTDWFGELWDSLYEKKGFSWDEDPFVAVITFERIEKPQEAE
ncbi:MAG: hypothetical protein FWG98_06875 [Candidatus Cloacimonetes bacterium]|nr:hypothetical protein [Candidatus Cloacimonadota bacterium]